MILSNFIKHLQKLETEYKDLKVVVAYHDEYWGTLVVEIKESEINIKSVKPDGPKSAKSENCIVLG